MSCVPGQSCLAACAHRTPLHNLVSQGNDMLWLPHNINILPGGWHFIVGFSVCAHVVHWLFHTSHRPAVQLPMLVFSMGYVLITGVLLATHAPLVW